jgi:hypothetical protein
MKHSKEVLIMAQHQMEHPTQRSRDGGAGKSSYLGEKGESFFIRACGRGDFKTVNLINRSTFALIDAFFMSEEEAQLFADKRSIRILDYNEDAPTASGSQERS